jgi:hypothetical protein
MVSRFFTRELIWVESVEEMRKKWIECNNQVVRKFALKLAKNGERRRALYHWIDGTWWFTTHVRAIVLPTFTWISAEPTIFANFTAKKIDEGKEKKRSERKLNALMSHLLELLPPRRFDLNDSLESLWPVLGRTSLLQGINFWSFQQNINLPFKQRQKSQRFLSFIKFSR